MLDYGMKLGISLRLPSGYALPITSRCLDPVITVGPKGYQEFTSDIRLSKYLSFILYNVALGGEVVLSWGGRDIWEGRIEDIALSQNNLTVVALGYSRALVDMPLTMFMSSSSYADWRPLNQEDYANAWPEQYYIDNNNRVYIAVRKDAETNGNRQGAAGYIRPRGSFTNIHRVTFDWEFDGPTGYTIQLTERNSSWVYIGAPWADATSGSLESGSEDITLASGRAALSFRLYGTSTVTYTGETGDLYLKITNLRLFGIDDTEITAKDVMAELVSHINSINPGQLSAETGQIGDPGLDLTDQVYEDVQAIDIIEGLQNLGDDQTPPRYWRASVYDGKRLQFRPIGDNARDYQVNFGDLVINRSVDTAYTGFYAAYNGASGGSFRIRTAQADNAFSARRLGFSRVGVINVQTTSQTQAEAARDAAVEDARYSLPFSAFTVKKLFSSLQTAVPVYLLKPGDNITIRNWPPILGERQDRLSSFRVLMTSINLRTGDLTVTPEQYPRSLDQMIARRDEGIF